MDAAAPPTTAVSVLMQQLKNGDISKMQLFQQLARLQARGASAAPPTSILQQPPPPPPPSEPGPIAPLGAFARPPTVSMFSSMPPLQQLVAEQPSAPPFTSFAYATDTYGVSAARSFTSLAIPTRSSLAQTGVTSGAKIVEGNAEFLATGVSHDKVPSFSVQEWMASKSRASIASSVGNSRQEPLRRELNGTGSQPQVHQSHSAVQALFSSHDDGFARSPAGFQSTSAPLPVDDDADPTSSPGAAYVYTPQRHYEAGNRPGLFGGDGFHGRHGDGDGKEPAYIDFTEHFRDDLDHALDGKGASMRDKNADGSPAGGGGNNATDEGKFHARVTRWKSQKEAIREQMKQQLLQSELSECTFAPKVNPKSTKVVAKLRGRQSDKRSAARSSPQAVSERLYQEADNYKAREELAAKMKAEEEAEMARECTFKPKINRASSLTDKVKAKYLDPQTDTSPSLAAATMEAAAKELNECTFQPKVNPIGHEMVSAQLYLQQDIYERLSRPCTANPDGGARVERRRSRTLFSDDDGADSDADSVDDGRRVGSPRARSTQDDFYVHSEGRSRRKRLGRRRSGTRERDRERPRSAGGVQTDEEKADRAKRFENFLERQRFHEQARVKRIEQTKHQLTPGYKPNINKASLQMMENGRKGDFLERITKYALRKEHDTVKSKTVRAVDPHCTFKPSINQASAKRKARSVTELSRGDLLRRETSQRLMKLKMEQAEMAALTFRPQLNRVSERHEGRLKILSSPDTYLQRIQQQSQAHTIKQRRALQEKELEEFAECTFKPRTIEAPAYVQRIARSVSLTKALKQQRQAMSKANEKPEWK